MSAFVLKLIKPVCSFLSYHPHYEATVRAMEALAGRPGSMNEADVALAASCVANGKGAIAYDDEPSLSVYDAVFGRGA